MKRKLVLGVILGFCMMGFSLSSNAQDAAWFAKAEQKVAVEMNKTDQLLNVDLAQYNLPTSDLGNLTAGDLQNIQNFLANFPNQNAPLVRLYTLIEEKY